MKEYLKILLREELLNEYNYDVIKQFSSKNVMYHCSNDFRLKFETENIKGGTRGNYGWGIYFASTAYKALDYGDFMTVVDKSNLNLLNYDEIITNEFINLIDNMQDDDIIKDINNNTKYNKLPIG